MAKTYCFRGEFILNGMFKQQINFCYLGNSRNSSSNYLLPLLFFGMFKQYMPAGVAHMVSLV
jgi:hypothetical protein